MRRIVLILVAIASTTLVSNGQEKGKNAVEVTLNPAALFTGSTGPLFVMPYLKARFFLQEDIAFRMGLGIDFNANTTHPFNSNENIEKNTAFGFSLSPGVEKHFGSGKFSPYIGTALTLSWKTSEGNTQLAIHASLPQHLDRWNQPGLFRAWFGRPCRM
jgi:hypothetical protein